MSTPAGPVKATKARPSAQAGAMPSEGGATMAEALLEPSRAPELLPVKPVTLAEMETIPEVKRRFERMRLLSKPRPTLADGEPLNPQLPIDLTVIDDENIGRLFSEFCVMAQYATERLAAHTVVRAAAEMREKHERAVSRLNKDGTVDDKAAQVQLDPKVRRWALETLTGEGVEALTKAMLESYLIGRDAVSREMTRRIALSPGPEAQRVRR